MSKFFYPSKSIVSDMEFLEIFMKLESSVDDYINDLSNTIAITTVPVVDIDTLSIDYDEESMIAKLFGIPIYSPERDFTLETKKAVIRHTGFCTLISQELYECKEGFKKIRKGSSLEYDGGYTRAKLYLDSETGHIIKVVFLTPTQAEFDKDECTVSIHPYPWFENKLAISEEEWEKIGSPYGFYTEANELRCLPIRTNSTIHFDKEDIANIRILGDGYPLLKRLRIQKESNYGNHQIFIDGYEVIDPIEIVDAYRVTESLFKFDKRVPYLYQVMFDHCERVLEITTLGSKPE